MALASYGIKFRGKTSIKGQALTTFVLIEEESKDETIQAELENADTFNEKLVLMVDNTSNKFRAKVAFVLIILDLSSIEHAIQLEFLASNNTLKYEALIVGMLIATEMTVKNLRVCSYFNLLVS